MYEQTIEAPRVNGHGPQRYGHQPPTAPLVMPATPAAADSGRPTKPQTPAVPAPHSLLADISAGVFYAVVLIVALIGSAQAAASHLGWKLPAALAAVLAAELGGVVLSIHADVRRRIGERAVVARTLSAAVAAGAVAINWFGHDNRFQAYFFAGFSVTGYSVYLILSGARYRDALRAAGRMVATAPAYPLWQWLRHPAVTRNACALAVADPALGVVASLAQARDAQRVADRQAAVATALRAKVAKQAGPVYAEIAVLTYDLDRVAALLADRADYAGLADLIAQDLTAARLAPTADQDEPVVAPVAGVDAPRSRSRRPRRSARKTVAKKTATTPAATPATTTPDAAVTAPAGPVATGPQDSDDGLLTIVQPLVDVALAAGRKPPGQRAIYDAIKAARNGTGVGFPRIAELTAKAVANHAATNAPTK